MGDIIDITTRLDQDHIDENADCFETDSHLFLIEVVAGMLGVLAWAEADDAEGAFAAALQLRKDVGLQGSQIRITNQTLGQVVWQGKNPLMARGR